ncbi:putative transcriptional regulator, AraC family [Streptomyces himastatinicus ATCC 53653]|uniref:Putative transcriptional regulator, AraC family n=2 Tax=Streptomyces violaceusniger group TaxID=2839105 RepID=D9WKU9_9ACTN|nr:putative transcriptional regulator, AraC family [Streptomyces himastatinicus ATCC 53653]
MPRAHADQAARPAGWLAALNDDGIGAAPLEYLIECRMSLARDALRRSTRSISELAFATGYESESAFSTAFRRVVGSSPKQFRDAAHSG